MLCARCRRVYEKQSTALDEYDIYRYPPSYFTLLLLHPLLPRRRPHTLQKLHMLPHNRGSFGTQHLQWILLTLLPSIKTSGTIPHQPPQKVGEVGQDILTCHIHFFFIIVILAHDPIDAQQRPQSFPVYQIERMGIQKSTEHQHESANDIGMYLGTAIPFVMGCNGL